MEPDAVPREATLSHGNLASLAMLGVAAAMASRYCGFYDLHKKWARICSSLLAVHR